jgi:flavin reductase (DIM6/NTAB) family NADH-FMN oxidoreductase RutF
MKVLEKFNFKTLYAVYPMSAVVATAYDGENKAVMSLVWHTPLSFEPPLFGISVSPKRFSHDVILRARAFAVHYFHYEHSDFVEKVGSTSGRFIDKYKEFNIDFFLSPLRNPIIKGAFLALDCYYTEHFTLGDHTLIVGEIQRVYYDENLVEVKGDYILLKDKRTVFYAGMGEYITSDPKTLIKLRKV